MSTSEQKMQGKLSIIDFNAAICGALKIYRTVYMPTKTEHMEPAEAKKANRLVRISLSDSGEPIDSKMERLAALLVKAYEIAGITFKDKGVKTVSGDDGDVFVRTLEVDIDDAQLGEKVAKAKRSIIPALAGIAAMQEAVIRTPGGGYDFNATPSPQDMQDFVAAAAHLADVKAVVQGARAERKRG